MLYKSDSDLCNDKLISKVQEFKREGEILLINFTEYDKWKDPDREEIEDENFKYFISGRLYMTDAWRAVINGIMRADGSKKIDECSERAICKIKKFLYDKLYLTELKDYEKEVRDFVQDRIKFTSTNWDFPKGPSIIERPDFYTRTIWFSVDAEDLRWWMDKYSSFIILIIKDGYELEEYEYFLRYGEIGPGADMALEVYQRLDESR